MEMVQQMLQSQKNELKQEMQEANLGQMLQESLTRGNLVRPSIENKAETAMITELSTDSKDDKEKSKPVIKSNVRIKAGTNIVEEDRDLIKER